MSAIQTVQVCASLCVAVPFVLVQLGRMTSSSRSYLVLNFAGSTTLALDAAAGHDWGFLLLEGIWALVSLAALVRDLTGGSERPAGTHAQSAKGAR